MRYLLVSAFLLITSCTLLDRRQENLSQQRASAQRFGSLRGEGPRKRILLLPFINETIEKDPAIPKTGRDSLISALRLTDNFVILDNGDLPTDVLGLKKNNSYDLEEISKIASQMGVSAIIEGRILEIKIKRWGDEVGLIRKIKAEVQATVGIRLYSALNHKEVLNEVRTATSDSKTTRVFDNETRPSQLIADPQLIRDALIMGFQGMTLPVVKAVDKLSWNGKIAHITGDRIFLNAGRLTGLNVGDILRVTEEGEDIYDPETGMLIGKAPGRMKGTLEVVSYFGKDGCISVVHSGSGFEENDIVELY